MAVKKIPMRMCTGCREMKPKSELTRVVRTTAGAIAVDATGKLNGRGAYLCKDAACLKRAIKAGALARALDTAIPQELYEQLEEELKQIDG